MPTSAAVLRRLHVAAREWESARSVCKHDFADKLGQKPDGSGVELDTDSRPQEESAVEGGSTMWKER